MKVAFVSPRYGLNVFGGAELATRQLAERLVRQLGWSSEVYTSCALDHITWEDVLPPGDTLINGVLVRRIPSVAGRDPRFFELDGRLRVAPEAATPEEARRWVELQGPLSPDVVEAAGRSGADVAVFYPYMYFPTVVGIGNVPMPAVLHPAAHDEPALYLPIYRHVFRSADALVYHTAAERQLVQEHFAVAEKPQLVLGLGVDPPPPRNRRGHDVLGIGDRPYALCLGRVDEHKGSRMLAEYFRTFKERNPGPLALAFVGPVNDPPAPADDIVVAGSVSETDKWDVLRDASVLISPSAYESFSLVVVEAASVEVPVLVNRMCGPTREFCDNSMGGLCFDSYPEFGVALQALLSRPVLRRRLGRAGARYVQTHFTWPIVIDRYAHFLEQMTHRPKLPSPLQQMPAKAAPGPAPPPGSGPPDGEAAPAGHADRRAELSP